ncbi:unnamed protein product, partial [Closterium sp. NIES-54]
ATLAHLPADRLERVASFASSSQHGQLRLAYVATRANTTNVFTKALPPAILPRLALVVTVLHTCSTTSATATTSTASFSPSSFSSTLIREIEAITSHMPALVTIVALAVESAATASVALVVAAVSATPAASIEVGAVKSAFPSSSAPSTAIPSADACCLGAIRTRQLTVVEILLKDRSLHVFKREAGQVTIEVDDERGP